MAKQSDYVLWVEDSIVDIKLLLLMLKKFKFSNKIEIVNYGYQVFPFLEEKSRTLPQLIILDIRLPDMEGTEILKEIKSNRLFSRIPVLIRTGIANKRLKAQCHRLGAEYFMEKGSDLNDVIKQARRIMELTK